MNRVKISDIVFDKPMHNTLRNEFNAHVAYEVTGTFGRLSRIHHPNLQHIRENQNYKDPVKLKRRPDGRYIILDGRHRVAMSFLKGFKTISAQVKL